MLKVRLSRRRLCIALLAVITLLLVAASPVFAYLYRAPFTISEADGTDYTGLAVNCSADVDWLIANGFITTATALDTRIETFGGVDQIHMMASDRIMAFVPSLSGHSQLNWYFTTGETSLADFPVIAGYSGYVTVTNAAALEPANNFSIVYEGWIDASRGAMSDIDDYETSNQTVEVTSHTVVLPAGIVSGNLLFVFFSGYDSGGGNPNTTTPAGWTSLYSDNTVTNTREVFYKVAGGAEGASVAVSTTVTCSSAHMTIRMDDYIGTPEVAGAVSGGASQPDSPSLAATAIGYLTYLSASMSRDGAATIVNSYPSGYTGISYIDSGAAVHTGVECAYSSNATSTEDPGAYTMSSVQDYWAAVTISIKRNAAVPIIKSAALAVYMVEDDLVAQIQAATPRTVTVYNIDSDEYLVEVWADTTNFGVDIDGVTANSTALGGSTVPGNANNWLISIPYFNYYKHYVNGSLIAWYQPVSYIVGTTLPDREGAAQNGIITWGSNPAGVSVALGSLTVPETTAIVSEDGDVPRQTTRTAEVTDWFLEPATGVGEKLENHPLRPLVQLMVIEPDPSDPVNHPATTELQAWRFLGLAAVLFVTVITAVSLRGHLLIAGLACGGTIAVLVQQTIWPGWALVLIIPAIVAGVLAERTPSIG